MQQIPISLLTLVAGILITLFSIWFGQNHGLLPEQASVQAPLVDGFFNIMVTIATALFVVVEGTIVIFLWKFRYRKGDEGDGLPIEGNLPLEVFWTAIPSIIVICLGIYSVDVFARMGGLDVHNHTSSHVAQVAQTTLVSSPLDASKTENKLLIGIGAASDRPNKPVDLTVDVTGMQFAWIFNYPDSGVTAGELHVPVGAEVQLNLSAKDVIHSFWVPQFRLKQDAIPGVPTQLRFVATKVGTYPIICTELCGGYHGSMRSQVIVHTLDEFESWLEQNRVAQQKPEQVVAVTPAELSSHSQKM